MKNKQNNVNKLLLMLGLSLIISSACFSQAPAPAFSLTTGTDFKGIMSTVGIEAGMYTANRKHSVMATLEADWMKNATLIKYDRPDLVHAETSTGKSSHSIGIKYAARVVNSGAFSVSAIAHPWHSVNLNITSAWYGGRVSITHRGDIVAAEFLHDPFAGRVALRFVFTAL